MKIVYIYALIDPRTNQVGYVGKADNPVHRLRTHLKPSCLVGQTKKVLWLKSLAACNLRPTLVVLENATKKTWQSRERYWIKFYREQNANLYNTTSGGAGVIDGAYFSPEARKKISQTHTGNKYNLGRVAPIAVRQKISQALKGNRFARGFKHSNETRQKVRLGNQRSGITKGNSSGYRGVSFYTRENRWVATIVNNRARQVLGYFKNKEDAARAYDTKARQLFGDDCFLNFPNGDS